MHLNVLLLVLLSPFAEAGLSVEEQLQNADGDRIILQETKIYGWINDPSFRGTPGILWSCSLTILASIYTAIHVNIPAERTYKHQNLLQRIRWTLIALLIPEAMLQLALRQFLAARELVKRLNEANIERGRGRPEFDMAYEFYVEMGGFVVDIRNISNNKHKFAAITAEGAWQLAEAGYVFDASAKQIEDRSKSDAFAKTLVCIQVSWMFIQCVTRAAIGYPLTLLEIHTMVHVVCAVVLYALWWHKPHDIKQPEIVDRDDKFRNIIATMLRESHSDKIRTQDRLDSVTGTRGKMGTPFYVTIMLIEITLTAPWAFYFLPLIYGAVHLAAWNFAFPSYIESILWKVSGLGIMGFVPISVIVQRHLCMDGLQWLLELLLPLVFLFFRTFLVIESFISLRELPLGAFATTPWLQAIPHI